MARRTTSAHTNGMTPRKMVLVDTSGSRVFSDAHRKSPLLAGYRARREKDGLVNGPAEVEIFRSLTD